VTFVFVLFLFTISLDDFAFFYIEVISIVAD